MKRAFSLLELLFAIVIVGISVAALPTIASITSKSNAQAVLSEVVTSSKIFIDDILFEPWNSAIAEGFADSSGAVMYSGILNAQSGDTRFSADDVKKSFHRTIARDKDGTPISAAAVGVCNSGINCKDKVKAELRSQGDGFKNAFEFDIIADVGFISVDEKPQGTKIIATFNTSSTSTTPTNAILVSATATGKGGAALVDDVKQIKLNGFAFNIGTEPR